MELYYDSDNYVIWHVMLTIKNESAVKKLVEEIPQAFIEEVEPPQRFVGLNSIEIEWGYTTSDMAENCRRAAKKFDELEEILEKYKDIIEDVSLEPYMT